MKRLAAILFLLASAAFCQQPTTWVDGPKATYNASKTAQASVAGASFFIQGSSTKTIRVTRIIVDYISTSTTIAYHTVTLQRYSALSGGTNNAVTASQLDTTDAAPTATVDQVSVVNTTQTAVGGVARAAKGTAQSTTAAAASIVYTLEWDFGDKPGSKTFVLRGTGDMVGVVFDATTATYDIWIEWTEE